MLVVRGKSLICVGESKYLDPDSGIFQPPGISNPDSPFYDPQLGNSTHIPIETPREELINELIGNN